MQEHNLNQFLMNYIIYINYYELKYFKASSNFYYLSIKIPICVNVLGLFGTTLFAIK